MTLGNFEILEMRKKREAKVENSLKKGISQKSHFSCF
jgi:hypothetical protein